MEDKNQEEGIVVLICLENGQEQRKSRTTYEAQMMVLEQEADRSFCIGVNFQCEIIGVESGDDDGFITAMLNGEVMTQEKLKAIIEE